MMNKLQYWIEPNRVKLFYKKLDNIYNSKFTFILTYLLPLYLISHNNVVHCNLVTVKKFS